MSDAVRLAAAALAAALLASACAGGPAPRDHFYRLEVPGPVTKLPEPLLAGPVEVEPLRSNPLVRERPILRSDGPDAVEVTPFRYHLWIESPVVAIQRALAADLRARGVAERVVTPEMRVAEAWVLTGHLLRLELLDGMRGGGVLVELELSLADSRGRLRWHGRYRAERDSEGGGVAGGVRAIGAALGTLFDDFAADLGALDAN